MSSSPHGAGILGCVDVAVYGTLRLPAVRRRLGLAAVLVPRGPCRLPGRLVDLGAYPGLVPGAGTVVGELLEVTTAEALATLDAYEGWDPAAPHESLFRREQIELVDPAGRRAWAYLYNRDPATARPIDGGDWLEV